MLCASRREVGDGLLVNWRKPRLPLGGRPFISSWKLRFPGSLLLQHKGIHYSSHYSREVQHVDECRSPKRVPLRIGDSSRAKERPQVRRKKGVSRNVPPRSVSEPPDSLQGRGGISHRNPYLQRSSGGYSALALSSLEPSVFFEAVSFHQAPRRFRTEPFPLDQIRSGAWRFSCS